MKLLLLTLLQVVLGAQTTTAPRKDRDAVIFPGPAARTIKSQPNTETKLAASIRIAAALSQYDTLDDMNNYLNITDPNINPNYQFVVESRIGTERSNVELAQPAACKPELQVVPMIEKPDSSVIYKPFCTRLKRCGGCCLHDNLACEPTETVFRNFEVRKLEITNDNLIVEVGREVVFLEEHKKCRCLCRTKEEHCTKRQIYIPEECRCACLNTDEERKCSGIANKLWNPNACACLCKYSQDCNSGYKFDENTCSCRIMSSRRFWSNDQITTSYNHQPSGHTAETPIIFPLNANDPRRKPKEDPEY